MSFCRVPMTSPKGFNIWGEAACLGCPHWTAHAARDTGCGMAEVAEVAETDGNRVWLRGRLGSSSQKWGKVATYGNTMQHVNHVATGSQLDWLFQSLTLSSFNLCEVWICHDLRKIYPLGQLGPLLQAASLFPTSVASVPPGLATSQVTSHFSIHSIHSIRLGS